MSEGLRDQFFCKIKFNLSLSLVLSLPPSFPQLQIQVDLFFFLNRILHQKRSLWNSKLLAKPNKQNVLNSSHSAGRKKRSTFLLCVEKKKEHFFPLNTTILLQFATIYCQNVVNESDKYLGRKIIIPTLNPVTEKRNQRPTYFLIR